MKCLLTWILMITLVCARAAAPAPAPAPSAPGLQPAADGSRFLFVVDTSQPMRAMSEISRQAVFEMIFTGLAGHMRSGDTFGLWAFDDAVYAGEFPMQVWDAQNPLDTASRAALFLHDRKCSGTARTDLLAEKLRVVMKIAVDVTILVVTAGEAPFQGTPFDESINAEYDMRGKERRRLKKPFVTTLVARGGQVSSARVTIVGEALTLPDRPVAAKPLTHSAPPRAASATGSTNAVARTPATPATQSSVPSVSAPSASVQATTVTETTPPAAPPTSPETQAPPPVAAQAPSTPGPKVAHFVTRSNMPPRQGTVVAENPAPAPGPTNAMASASERPANPAPPAARAEVPVLPEVPADPAPSPVTASPRAGLLSAVSPAPLPVAAREATPDTTPPPAVAVAAPPNGAGLSAPILLTMGSVLLAAVLFLLVVVLHRLRGEPRPSFITQSMERRQL
jgi:hypothetical protein